MDWRARNINNRRVSRVCRNPLPGRVSIQAIVVRITVGWWNELAQIGETQSEAKPGTSFGTARRDKKKLLDKHREIQSGEIVVLLQDECHLLWGDCLGYVWGKRGEAIEVLMCNERERQTYFGAINLLRQEFHLQAKPKADGANTVEYVKWLQEQYPGKRLWLLWDGASFHRYGEMRSFLAEQNQGLAEEEWKITCLWFAPNAPEQNPVEDIWLSGKQAIRRCFDENKTFMKVKECFVESLKEVKVSIEKLSWYWTNPQTI